MDVHAVYHADVCSQTVQTEADKEIVTKSGGVGDFSMSWEKPNWERRPTMRTTTPLLIAAAFAALSTTATAAPQISSQYEKINTSQCPTRPSDDGMTGYGACATKLGPDLLIQYSEHAVWVYLNPAYNEGLYGEDSYSGPYTPGKSGHFGSMFEDKNKLTTLEWRVAQENGAWKPFALIYRTTYSDFSGADGQPKGRSRLEVIKFGAGHACHLGFVEGQEADHNAKARALADANLNAITCPPGN